MKSILPYLFFFLLLSTANSQQIIVDTTRINYQIDEDYDVQKDTIILDEIVISKEELNPDEKKRFEILKKRVLFTYPYAKIASERLTNLTRGMNKLTTDREKKKYFKIVENYMTNEFEARLKKMSRGQGRILIKLIHRQTGSTTYSLIKTLKSGWKAFWSNTTASMFDINLKTEFLPYTVNEDYLIENILIEAFERGQLNNQAPANPIDINKLNEYWENKK